MALGLRAVGVKPGDVVGLIGDNRPDWVMGEIATHALRARSLGIYRDALDDEVAYLLAFSGTSTVIAEDEEQVDKLLNVSEQVPGLRHIIYCDPRGMRKHADPRLVPMAELLRIGAEAATAEPAAWNAHCRCNAWRGYRDPLHHIGHDGAAEARATDLQGADPPLRSLPGG